MSIRIGILGYGNLGRGVECAVKQNPDMELAADFTRRNPADVHIMQPAVWQKHRWLAGLLPVRVQSSTKITPVPAVCPIQLQ